jgi:hypothetical protein
MLAIFERSTMRLEKRFWIDLVTKFLDLKQSSQKQIKARLGKLYS